MKSYCFAIFVVFALFVTTSVATNDEKTEENRVGGFINDFLGYNVTDLYSADERKDAAEFIKMHHNTKRYANVNGKLTTVSSDFCCPTSEDSNGTYSLDDCQWELYLQGLFTLPSIAFSVAFLIFPCLFCGICWCRCCCCGKYSATPELCCGDPNAFNPTFHGYTTKSVWVFFTLAVLCSVIIGGSAVISTIGNAELSTNVYDAVNFTNFTLVTFSGLLDTVVDVFEVADNDFPNLSSSIDMDAIRTVGEVAKNLTNYTDIIHDGVYGLELVGQIVANVVLFAPFICILLVLISRFCCWGLAWPMAALGFIFSAGALCMFSFLYPLSIGLSDGCILLNKSVSDPDADPLLNSLFDCKDGSPIAKLTEIANDTIESAAGYGCSFFDELEDLSLPCEGNDSRIVLNNSNYMCPLVYVPKHEDCTASTLGNLTQDSKVYDWKIGCFCPQSDGSYKRQTSVDCGTIHELNSTECDSLGPGCRPFYCYSDKDSIKTSFKDCAEKCSDNSLNTTSRYIAGYSKVVTSVLNVYEKDIKPYINCESFNEILTFAQDFVCVGVINSFTLSYIGQIICAIGCFFGTFVALLGMKRFNKKYRQDYAGHIFKGSKEELSSLLDQPQVSYDTRG